MDEKRMLIVDAEVARRIDENRGDMSIADFISFLIDNQFNRSVVDQRNNNITKEEFQQFEEGIKDLMRNFLEFFLSYGLELGKKTEGNGELERLAQKLQSMGFKAKHNKP